MLLQTLTLLSLAATGLAQISGANTTRSFLIKTCLQPNQTSSSNVSRFEDLYLTSYHTGAGLNDAVLTANASTGIHAFFNTSSVAPTANNSASLEFVGGAFPYAFVPTIPTYAGWGFVEINAGNTGAWVDKGSLRWTLQGFEDWMVCDWWHGVPQLFAKVGYLNVSVPEGCATVALEKEYI